MGIDIVLIIVGLALLVWGADLLVKGAVHIATKAGISKLVVGMTVVAFGTSAPELIVSLQSAWEGYPEIAIGNVVGSNIANIGLILGLTAIIFPIAVSKLSIKQDWPIMFIASLLFYGFGYNLWIERWEGIIMLGLIVMLVIYMIRKSIKDNSIASDELAEVDGMISDQEKPLWKSIVLVVVGLVLLYFGSDWMINGATNMAQTIGVSNRVIAVTVVAFGTSVPELATSFSAAFKKEMDISVGNIIGSNIFNILAVLGITAIVRPIPIEESVLTYDLLWMLGISLALLPLMLWKRTINRFSGLILLAGYVVYIVTLF